MSLARYAAHLAPSSSLFLHALAEEIPEDGFNSPSGSGKSCLLVGFNLKRTRILSNYKFSKEKILAILLQFAKIFSLQNFVLYGIL